METPVTVATYNDRTPAENLVRRLREAGFDSHLHDESAEQKWKLFNLTPRAHLRVRVRANEEDRALEQVAQWSREASLDDAIQCPECGSSRIEFPQFSRRTIVGALPAALAAAGVIEQDYYCQSCQYTWPAVPPAPDPEVDALNWPKR